MTADTAVSNRDEERLEIVRDLERLTALGPAWADLWRESGALIFQSHAWVHAWWSHVPDRDRRALLIVLAWRGDRLEAVLPLATNRKRSLRLLEWAAKDYTDYCDAVLRPGVPPVLLERMWGHISAEGGFDLVHLGRLLPTATVRSILNNRNHGVLLRPNHRSEQSLRVAGTWADGDAWFEAQSKKTRQNYRRGQKFIGDNASLRSRLLPPDEPKGPALHRLAELKRLWLVRSGIEAPLFDEGSPTLAALVQALADNGQLRVFVLEREGVVVAISINFMQNATMMAFLTTYDPEFERGSPGMVLMIDYIKWSFDNGVKTVDFLCGAEDFKSRFSTNSVLLDSVAGARTLPGRAALMADRLVHWLKTWRVRRPAQPLVETDA